MYLKETKTLLDDVINGTYVLQSVQWLLILWQSIRSIRYGLKAIDALDDNNERYVDAENERRRGIQRFSWAQQPQLIALRDIPEFPLINHYLVRQFYEMGSSLDEDNNLNGTLKVFREGLQPGDDEFLNALFDKPAKLPRGEELRNALVAYRDQRSPTSEKS
jgi:hypothetical protein